MRLPTISMPALAVAYSFTGDKDHVFQYIRYPAFDAIHTDPRYTNFMRQLNLPE
jgi:hypothetical protein